MREKLAFVIKALFESVKYTVESFTLPTGKHLLPAFMFGSIILGITIVCAIFNLPCIIEWPGALVGVLVLLAILIIERSERSEVSAFYRVAQSSVQSVVQRAKELSPHRATPDGPMLDVNGEQRARSDADIAGTEQGPVRDDSGDDAGVQGDDGGTE